MSKKYQTQQKPTPTFFVRVYHDGDTMKLNLTNSTIEKAKDKGREMWKKATNPKELTIKDKNLVLRFRHRI